MITVKIDVTKIDKAKLYQGKKGKYLSLVLIETPNGQYGDFMVKQEQSKEERQSGVKTEILGNASYIQKKSDSRGPQPTRSNQPPAARPAFNPDDDTSDVPF